MPLRAGDLAARLSRELAPIYLVAGDDPLRVQEAGDAVAAAARQQGFEERSLHYVEPGFDWQALQSDAASLSLFASRRLLDVRVPSAKFDRDASAVLRAYAEAPPADTLLLIRSGRLDAGQRKSAWFKALDRVGVVVLIWPLEPRELPGWLQQRLVAAGLEMTREAVDYFAERIEGNLLAAVQEIEKLRLLELASPIELAVLQKSLGDAAHYDAFELIDAVMAGEPARVRRIVAGLREEGVAVFAVLGALTSQLRRLRDGQGRMPPQRQRLVQGFQRRLGSRTALDRILAQCALVDQQGKGQLLGDPWLSLESLLLRMAGVTALPAPEAELALRLRR